MVYVVKEDVVARLREEPLATSRNKKTMQQGDELGDPVRESDGFLFFEINAALNGWMLKDDCEELPDAARQPINEKGFVQECVNVQFLFNDETKPVEGAPPAVTIRPWVVSADFLIARALYETDIRNLGRNIPGSDAVGALQVTAAEWKEFTVNGGALAKDARASDRDHSVLQIPAAAWRQHVHGKAMSKIRLDAGKATAEDPFIPSFLDMFFAHVTNSPAAAIAILDAQEAGTAPETSIKDVLKAVMPAEDLSALFKAREKLSGLPTVFFGTEANPSTLKSVVDIAEDTLKKLLVAALGRIEKHRPEMIPVVTAGGAPWMAIAEKAEADGVKEGPEHNAEISGYFKHTDFGGNPNTNPPPAWCGAFAAHCMKGCDNPIIKASVPKEAAAAISWRKWGTSFPLQSPTIPRGAVVVLSLEPGATSGTGHVGFFLEFSPDKKKVILLGGNQSKRVGKTPFLANRIAEVRWLDQPGAVESVDGITLPQGIAAGNRQFAGLILKAFAAAGYGRDQQIAALANAIGESNLNPEEHNTHGEDSVGLFQLNRDGGVGTGHTVEQLKNPAFNTQLIIAEADRVPPFKNAKDLHTAVEVFVRRVERPADPAGQTVKRFKIAQALIA